MEKITDPAKLKAASTYNAAADHFDDGPLAFWDRYGRGTIERLRLKPGSVVLDVGCGSGASAIPAAETCCHEMAASTVFQIAAVCVWHDEAGEPALSRTPITSSANETSMLARPGGSERSTHVSPRSNDRKRRVPATKAHTTVPDVALS